MGKLGRRLLDFVRAGALAAGTAFLLGVWFQGMARLGFRGSYPDGLPDFLMVVIAGIGVGSVLGFRSPAARWLDLVGRVAGTSLGGIAIAAALGGVTALLVKGLDVAERDLPIYFLVVGASSVGVGLRRVPRSTAARVALAVPVGLLIITRLLALWPTGAHAITAKLFPLSPDTVRSELERVGWGPLAIDKRTKIVAFETTPSYRTEHTSLVSDSIMRFTLEAVRPFYEDACGQLTTETPFIPPFVRNYPTREACEKEHPARHFTMFEMYHHRPSPCCVFEVKQRQPGERFAATRKWEFIFQKLAWRASR